MGSFAIGTGGSTLRQVLYSQPVNVAVTGVTTEAVLWTGVIPAGLLGTGGCLSVTCTWSHTNNADSKTKRVRLGGIAGFDMAGAHVEASTATSRDYFESMNTATNAQIAYPNSNFGGSTAAILTGAIDTTVNQNLVVTGQLATSTDTLTLLYVRVEIERA